jgi:hypothetical protein
MKLGAYYYDGWYEFRGNWTPRLLNEFAEREPSWGWLGNTVENMELQIDLAADGGLGFFAFDWYYPENGGEERGNNKCIDRYLASKNANRLDFCLLVANHQGAYIYRDKWEDACARFMRFLKSDHALKVDGKPVIIFFSTNELVRCLGSVEETNNCLAYLREEAKKEGLPGVFVIGCAGPQRTPDGAVSLVKEQVWKDWCNRLKDIGLDGVTGYNYHRGAIIREDGTKDYLYPFEDLAHDHEVSWEGFINFGTLPYMPCLTGGWDDRPNEKPDKNPEKRSCYSPDITPPQLYHHVKACGDFIKENKQKITEDYAIIYAWNENGEGGFVCPTIGGHKDKLLSACKRAVDDSNK